MNEKLLRKLIQEEPLDAAEHLELEQALESGDHSMIAHYFSSQDHIEPSLAWRSELNEQLRQIAPKPVVPIWRWLGWGGAVAAAAASCAAMVFFMGKTSAEPSVQYSNKVVADSAPVEQDQLSGPPSELGRALVSAHQSDATQVSIGVRSPKASMQTASNSKIDFSSW